MIDIGWSELLVIGIVALIVVGPKDLPIMFRRLGEFTGKARAMAREFSSAMDKAADDAGVKDIQRDLRGMANPRKTGLDALKKATDGLDDWDGAKPNRPATTPPVNPGRAKATVDAPAPDPDPERPQAAAQAVTDEKAQ